MDRIEVITKSLRCFTLGLVGCVPLLGLPASVLAITIFQQVTWRKRDDWNPARRYLLWGFFLGAFSLLLSVFVGMLVTIAILRSVLD